MRIPVAFLTLAAATSAASGAPAAPSPVLPANVERLESVGEVTQYRLKSNGMKILLARNDAAPVFTFLVVYHVGSRNEAPGSTGSAHLLEHLLFNKSTENFGKAKGHKTFQETLYAAGADFSSTNMTTWNDRMTGYSTLPSDKLELAMRIEADRLGRGLLLDSERQPEMSVVRNEYEIGENDPSQALNKALVGTAIVAHPYHWDTIGYRSDIEGVPTSTLRAHYENYFWPDNSEAILVGDFDPSRALALFDAQFGKFPRSARPVPQVITVEPPQEGERRITVKRPGQVGIVQIGCMRPGALSADFPALDILGNVLTNGVGARLSRALVDTGIASNVVAVNYPFRDPYPMLIEAVVGPDSTHAAVEEALRKSLAQIVSQGITEAELAQAKKQLEVALVQARDGTYNLASVLGEAIASADWKWALTYADKVRGVSAADVKRVASSYLVPDKMTVGWFVPAEATAPAPVAAAAPAPAAPSAAPSTPEKPLSRGFPSAPPAGAAQAGTTGESSTGSARFAARTLHRVLRNGITLDIVENRAVPTVSVAGIVTAGGMTAPAGSPALPGLTAMMLSRGTKSRDKQAIGALLDGAGAVRTWAASPLQTDLTGSSLSRDLPMLLEVLADELRNPALPAEEITRAKAEMKTAIRRAADTTSTRAWERLSQVAFPEGHPYRAADAATMLADLEGLSEADLKSFHAARYNGAGTILAIVGDLDAEKTAALVEKLFGGLPKGSRPAYNQPRQEPVAPVREAVTLRGKANMHILFGMASRLRRNDPDYEAALIANAALGQTALASRVGKRVRDTEGLSYSLSSRFQLTDALDGVWGLLIAVAPQNAPKALASARDEIVKYGREGITDEEVRTQQSFFAGNYRVRLGSNGGIAAALVAAEKIGAGPAYLDEFPERIQKVTKDQVNEALKKHIRAESLSLIIAGDLDTLPE